MNVQNGNYTETARKILADLVDNNGTLTFTKVVYTDNDYGDDPCLIGGVTYKTVSDVDSNDGGDPTVTTTTSAVVIETSATNSDPSVEIAEPKYARYFILYATYISNSSEGYSTDGEVIFYLAEINNPEMVSVYDPTRDTETVCTIVGRLILAIEATYDESIVVNYVSGVTHDEFESFGSRVVTTKTVYGSGENQDILGIKDFKDGIKLSTFNSILPETVNGSTKLKISGDNQITFSVRNSEKLILSNSSLEVSNDANITLGSQTNKFYNLYVTNIGTSSVKTANIYANNIYGNATSSDKSTRSSYLTYYPSSGNPTDLLRADSSTSIIPSSNNSIILGSSNLKFSNIYSTTFTGNLSGNSTTSTNAQGLSKTVSSTTYSLSLDTSYGWGTNASIYPTQTILNLGDSDHKWSSIYANNINASYHYFYRGTGQVYLCYVSSHPNELILNGTLIPNSPSYGLGASDHKWSSIYAHNVYSTIGSSINRQTIWANTIYFSSSNSPYIYYSSTYPNTLNIHGNFSPDNVNTYDLGRSSSQWRTLYVKNVGTSGYPLDSIYSNAYYNSSGNDVSVEEIIFANENGSDISKHIGYMGVTGMNKSSWPTRLRLKRCNGTQTDIHINLLVASALIGRKSDSLSPYAAEGSIALIQVRRSSGSVEITRGSLISYYTSSVFRGMASDSSTGSLAWTSESYEVTGTWCVLNYVGTSYGSQNYCMVLAIRIY